MKKLCAIYADDKCKERLIDFNRNPQIWKQTGFKTLKTSKPEDQIQQPNSEIQSRPDIHI